MIASELPVYIDTYQLVNTLMDYSADFPKMYKYTIGQKITNVSLELFEYIQLANMTMDATLRAKYLQGFQIKHELLKVLIRICTDKQIISMKKSAHLAQINSSIGKQISAWKNKQKSEIRNP